MVLVASWVYLLFEGYSDKMGLEKDDLMYKYVSMIRVFRVLRPMRTLRLFGGAPAPAFNAIQTTLSVSFSFAEEAQAQLGY